MLFLRQGSLPNTGEPSIDKDGRIIDIIPLINPFGFAKYSISEGVALSPIAFDLRGWGLGLARCVTWPVAMIRLHNNSSDLVVAVAVINSTSSVIVSPLSLSLSLSLSYRPVQARAGRGRG